VELHWDESGIAEIIARCEAVNRGITEAVAADARIGCPVDEGDLKASIRVTHPSKLVGRVYVGTDHWRPTEYGSLPHPIQARRPGGMLRFFWEKKNRWFIGPRVNHPGTPSQPFMRPATYRQRVIPGLP
jgi:hypothetical protein